MCLPMKHRQTRKKGPRIHLLFLGQSSLRRKGKMDFRPFCICGERWIYENPFAPARLYDDEIAIAG